MEDPSGWLVLLDLATSGGGLPGMIGWLSIAFALGLVHAFDADHVMAVTALATGERGARRGVFAGLRWAIGHGGTLLVVGLLAIGFGQVLPPAVGPLAERIVGVLMVALGIGVLGSLLRQGSHVHFHRHQGLPPHAHWHRHDTQPRRVEDAHPGRGADSAHQTAGPHQHRHTASLVGAVHGLAGSAPILALLPVTLQSPALGFAYLVLFGIGVGCAMACVSGALGHLVERLSASAQGRALALLRGGSGLGSIAVGLWLGFSV